MGRNLPWGRPSGRNTATHLILDLRENYNIFCSMVIYPVVPKGDILLRLIPTAMHNLDDVKETIDAFTECRAKLEAGEYKKDEFTDISKYAS